MPNSFVFFTFIHFYVLSRKHVCTLATHIAFCQSFSARSLLDHLLDMKINGGSEQWILFQWTTNTYDINNTWQWPVLTANRFKNGQSISNLKYLLCGKNMIIISGKEVGIDHLIENSGKCRILLQDWIEVQRSLPW